MNKSSKQKDLVHFVGATDLLYQKEKVSATGKGTNPIPEADNADIGDAYNNE